MCVVNGLIPYLVKHQILCHLICGVVVFSFRTDSGSEVDQMPLHLNGKLFLCE